MHTIGIGSCDPDLVKRCAIVGNGYSYFTGTVSVHQSIIEALDNTQKMKKFECTYENNYKDKTYLEYNQKLFISPHDFIRYGFILDEKISDIEILIKAKDKENKLKFNKNNIKQLPDGDKLGKIIVDNYLKKNKEIDTSKIIKLSKAFSILTPETAFFAEIQNEDPINENMLTFSTKGKTVDYNEKGESIIEENKFESNDFGFDIKTDSPKKKKKNIFNKFLNLFSKNKKNEIIKKKEYIYDSPSKYKKENNYDSYLSKPEYKKPKYKKSKTNYKKSKKGDMEDLFIGYSCPRPDYEKEDEIKFIFEKREVKKEEKREAKKEEKKEVKNEIIKKKFNFNEVILTQDAFEGKWEINEETKLLIEEEKTVYEKIKKISENKGINEENGIITLLVLYYIYEKCQKRIDELKFVINKAKTYIKKIYRMEYEDISKEF